MFAELDRIGVVTAPCRITLLILAHAMSLSAAYPQTTTGPADPLLGRAHLWVDFGRTDLSNAAARAWGVDREGYVGLEAYRRSGGESYFGGGIGRSGAGRATNADGDTIRDFQFVWLELNGKRAFELKRGFTFDAGLGGSLFYAEGQEVSIVSGQEFTDPLADLGFGAQAFVDFTWRARRLLLGLEAEYQMAFDIINVNYSNLRLGGHLGVAF